MSAAAELEELVKLRGELQRSLNRVERMITVMTHMAPVEEKEAKVPKELIQEVFQYWVDTVKAGRKGIKLSTERERKIRLAIESYDVETAKQAIDGILLSSFHMGENSDQKRFDDIELILRNSVNIEKFRDLAAESQVGGGAAQDFLQAPF